MTARGRRPYAGAAGQRKHAAAARACAGRLDSARPGLLSARGMAPTTPEAVNELFERHLNAGDLDALAALYEEDAVLLPQPGVGTAGRVAIREALAAFVTAKARLQCCVTQVVRTGDLAMLFNDWSGTVTDPEGVVQSVAGHAIQVVRRQPDGTWRFVIDDPYARG